MFNSCNQEVKGWCRVFPVLNSGVQVEALGILKPFMLSMDKERSSHQGVLQSKD